MAYPFHMSSAVYADNLYLLSDGRYLPIRDGPLGPLMCGFEYILVEQALADFLRELNLPQVSFEPAVIWRIKSKESFTSHVLMIVGHEFAYAPPESFDLPLDGDRLYRMGDYLFVSPSLRERLLASPFDYLRFSLGFSEFAA